MRYVLVENLPSERSAVALLRLPISYLGLNDFDSLNEKSPPMLRRYDKLSKNRYSAYALPNKRLRISSLSFSVNSPTRLALLTGPYSILGPAKPPKFSSL